LPVLFFTLVFFSGLVLIPFVGIQNQSFHWQNYAGVYETPTPTGTAPELALDFDSGAPGSYFVITGTGFAPGSILGVRANGNLLGNTQADQTGNLNFRLNTTIASLGRYDVEAGAVADEVTFVLFPNGPIHPPTGGGQVFNVPPGIAIIEAFLPFVHR